MSPNDINASEPVPTDKEYTEIIRSDVETDEQYINEDGLPTKIVYFCQDCKKQVKPKREGRKFKFSCTECKGKNVSFGSEKSVESYYKNANKK